MNRFCAGSDGCLEASNDTRLMIQALRFAVDIGFADDVPPPVSKRRRSTDQLHAAAILTNATPFPSGRVDIRSFLRVCVDPTTGKGVQVLDNCALSVPDDLFEALRRLEVPPSSESGSPFDQTKYKIMARGNAPAGVVREDEPKPNNAKQNFLAAHRTGMPSVGTARPNVLKMHDIFLKKPCCAIPDVADVRKHWLKAGSLRELRNPKQPYLLNKWPPLIKKRNFAVHFVSPRRSIPGTHILYWAQSSFRVKGNRALRLCLWLSHQLWLPVAVVVNLSQSTHVHQPKQCESCVKFVLREASVQSFASSLESMNIPVFVFRCEPDTMLREWDSVCKPHVIITDEIYQHILHPEPLPNSLGAGQQVNFSTAISCSCHAIDNDNLCPPRFLPRAAGKTLSREAHLSLLVDTLTKGELSWPDKVGECFERVQKGLTKVTVPCLTPPSLHQFLVFHDRSPQLENRLAALELCLRPADFGENAAWARLEAVLAADGTKDAWRSILSIHSLLSSLTGTSRPPAREISTIFTPLSCSSAFLSSSPADEIAPLSPIPSLGGSKQGTEDDKNSTPKNYQAIMAATAIDIQLGSLSCLGLAHRLLAEKTEFSKALLQHFCYDRELDLYRNLSTYS